MPRKRKNLNISGSNLWYLVGLITSDGNLSPDGRHINITSKDRSFLCKLKEAIGLSNKVGVKNKTKTNLAYQIQFANIEFYGFLLKIGLLPRKSLTLGKLKIPTNFFHDFLRGLIDGDGGIQRWKHATNLNEQWSLRLASGSKYFLMWVKQEVELLWSAKGRIYLEDKKSTCYRLKYGKMAACKILEHCYYENAFGLDRKKQLALQCVNSYRGWSKSKTVNEGAILT
ncbi:hypothetical protein ACFL0T_06880 [Candidatus Omnitrophota bacterium]